MATQKQVHIQASPYSSGWMYGQVPQMQHVLPSNMNSTPKDSIHFTQLKFNLQAADGTKTAFQANRRPKPVVIEKLLPHPSTQVPKHFIGKIF